MKNGHEVKTSNLETIPEETGLPRISQLIPKSPETRKQEQEYERLREQYLNDKSIELFYEMLITNTNLKRIYSTDNYCISSTRYCKSSPIKDKLPRKVK